MPTCTHLVSCVYMHVQALKLNIHIYSVLQHFLIVPFQKIALSEPTVRNSFAPSFALHTFETKVFKEKECLVFLILNCLLLLYNLFLHQTFLLL